MAEIIENVHIHLNLGKYFLSCLNKCMKVSTDSYWPAFTEWRQSEGNPSKSFDAIILIRTNYRALGSDYFGGICPVFGRRAHKQTRHQQRAPHHRQICSNLIGRHICQNLKNHRPCQPGHSHAWDRFLFFICNFAYLCNSWRTCDQQKLFHRCALSSLLKAWKSCGNFYHCTLRAK